MPPEGQGRHGYLKVSVTAPNLYLALGVCLPVKTSLTSFLPTRRTTRCAVGDQAVQDTSEEEDKRAKSFEWPGPVYRIPGSKS